MVSNKLCLAVFGDPMVAASRRIGEIDPRGVTEHLIAFSMENPELGRAWLFELLRSSHPASDPFWKLYKSKFDKFAKSELAQPGIDTESHSVLVLVGAFLWPVWARAHAHSPHSARRWRSAIPTKCCASACTAPCARRSSASSMRSCPRPKAVDWVASELLCGTNGRTMRLTFVHLEGSQTSCITPT